MTDLKEYTVTRLGGEGDGLIETADGPRYVPLVLPGERVRQEADGTVVVTSAPSPDRASPVCRHFPQCGGCAAQHMREDLYGAWKQESVALAFKSQRLDVPIAPMLTIPPASRRRAVFTAQSADDGIRFGFHGRKSHAIVDLQECPVMVPAIATRLDDLRAFAKALPRRADEIRIAVAALDGGLDVAITGAKGKLSAVERSRLAERAASIGLARVTIDGDVIVTRTDPVLATIAGDIRPPPGAFFQAVAEAERAMVEQITAAVGKAKRIVDLFAGIGTFSLPLARIGRVLAVDSDKALLEALADATRRAERLKPIETKLRDLFREPLSVKELEGFDAAVFDPPRAGADAQAAMLAKSRIKTVVAVSCNPATLARDARILVDGGYTCERVTPIDQFLFTAHVEAVAIFRRK